MLIPPMRSRKKTAAASVEATIEPSSRPSSSEKSISTTAASEKMPVVRMTPRVASVSAGAAAILKEWIGVMNPESNSTTASASDPSMKLKE